MMKALFMLLLTALANAEENVSRIVSVEDIKFYKLVDYFTERTLRDDSKVRDIGLSPSEYTMHMYLAWRDADKSLSTVAVESSSLDTLVGANMVMSYPALMTMYAPGVISRVLDFTIPCYKSAVAVEANGVPSGKIFISTLRAADTDALNWQLIRETLLRFKILGPIDSYHLMWGKMDQRERLEELGYHLSALNDSRCNWEQLGLSREAANDHLLFVIPA